MPPAMRIGAASIGAPCASRRMPNTSPPLWLVLLPDDWPR
jgi:hypothetical protein